MENNVIYMHHDLTDLQEHPLPATYRFRLFTNDADTDNWAQIVTETKEFAKKENALTRFKEEFSPHLDEVRKRMLFIETDQGEAVGTATAWYGERDGLEMGRLHWVSIIPAHQGKGLGRPLIMKAMDVLASYHRQAYLTTQSSSPAAIHLYEGLGWYVEG